MTAMDYLKRLKRIENLIEEDLNEVGRLRKIIYGLKSPSDFSRPNVKSSPSGNRKERLIDQMCDYEEEVNGLIDKLVDERMVIIDQIQNLVDTRMSSLLYKRYVEYKDLAAIAEEMGYSYAYTKRLHKAALEAFREKYENILKEDTE